MSRILELYDFLVSVGEMDPLLTSDDRGAIALLEMKGLKDPESFLRDIKRKRQAESAWIEKPVPIDQWIDDPFYVGSFHGFLYPKLREDIVEIFRGEPSARRYWEVILTGAIGTGKSVFAAFCCLRQLYEIGCMAEPQRYCGIEPGTPIVMINLSVTSDNAQNSVFYYVRNMVRGSPWFMENFAPDPRANTLLRLPRDVMFQPGTSSEFSAIGRNMISGVIDEANFMISVSRRMHEKLQGDVEHALVLYRALLRRIESRFMLAGAWKGLLIVASSKIFTDDFIQTHIRDVKNAGNEGVYIMDYAHWEPRGFQRGVETYDKEGRRLYSGEVFRVAYAESADKCKVLESEDEEVAEGVHIVEVPSEYRDAFELDLVGAIRDIAGRSLDVDSPWIPSREKIEAGIIDEWMGAPLLHPFEDDTVHGVSPAQFDYDPDALSETYIYEENKKRFYLRRPKRKPEASRYIHVDLALSSDAAGFAMGGALGSMRYPIRVANGETAEIEVPIIVFEVLANFIAPVGGEIDFTGIRQLICELRDHCGFPIQRVTFDQFQSADSRQILAQQNFETDILSVDASIDPYLTLKNGIIGGWVKYYPHETAIRELKKIRRVTTKTGRLKVDHPDRDSGNPRRQRGSKDVTDAMAAVVANVLKDWTAEDTSHLLMPYEGDPKKMFTPPEDYDRWMTFNHPLNNWPIH